MLNSMTGFGRCECSNDKYKMTVEMKAVNHRYFDLNIKMPRKFNAFESSVRTVLKEYIQRGKVDVFVSGLGSGGTLQGIGRYLKEKNPDLKLVAVEPKNVSALLGHEPGIHKIQGIGDGFVPDVLDTSLIDDIVEVTDEDAFATTRELASVQGLLCGTSSGANVWAAKQMAAKYGKDKIIATVMADRMERYFSTGLLDA